MGWTAISQELRRPLSLTRFKDGINVYHSSTCTHTAKTQTSILDFHYLQILIFNRI